MSYRGFPIFKIFSRISTKSECYLIAAAPNDPHDLDVVLRVGEMARVLAPTRHQLLHLGLVKIIQPVQPTVDSL